jgi:hypothetical protein
MALSVLAGRDGPKAGVAGTHLPGLGKQGVCCYEGAAEAAHAMKTQRAGKFIVAFILFLAAAAFAADRGVMVSVCKRPGGKWTSEPTRTIATLPGYGKPQSVLPLDSYGGDPARRAGAPGYFRTVQTENRWWLVDPEGGLFIHIGVAAVAPGRSSNSRAAFQERFASERKWAGQTSRLLRSRGFNGAGAWSADNLLRGTSPRLVYTLIWNFMSEYGRKRGGTTQQPGHTGYPSDCIFVFDPEFETFCDLRAKALAATKSDPYLLGHFSDNELPFPDNALDLYLQLKPEDAGCKAAHEWLKKRGKDGAAITDKDREEFLEYVADTYFKITTQAIRKYDRNHLCLGARFHGTTLGSPAVFRAAGRYVDVISINYYDAWTPHPYSLRAWEQWADKPLMITEFYVKGADSGLPNKSGAGWIVKTQNDRGQFYQNFALGLLESGVCVGWHWFKYMDNDPTDRSADPSNRDSNKGIVTSRYAEYTPLLERMSELNTQVYELVDYFDKQR